MGSVTYEAPMSKLVKRLLNEGHGHDLVDAVRQMKTEITLDGTTYELHYGGLSRKEKREP